MKRVVWGILLIGAAISCLNVDNSPIIIPAPIDFEDQLALDIALIDTFLIENSITATVHETGIRYVLEVEGTGDSATVSDVVNVIYEGRLLDGQIFDSNENGFSFLLSDLIQAWQITIPLMKEGGKITIYAPSVYCYGNSSIGSIPPNANLIFDIELVEVGSN